MAERKLALHSSQQSINHDKEMDYIQTPLYKAFNPLIVSLKLVGMHYTLKKTDTGKYSAVSIVSQAYSWFLTILAWAMAVRAAATLRLFNSSGPELLSVLSSITWITLCALNASCFLKAAYNPESMMEYFFGFTKLNKFGGSFVCPQRVTKFILAGTLISWIIVITNAIVLSYLINATQLFDFLATDPLPLDSDTTSYRMMKIIFTIIDFFLTAFWVFPSAMQFSTCFVVYQELKLFCASLESKINDDGDFTGKSLEPDRKRFLQIVKIIESTDNCLSLHQSAALGCNIINICLLLYVMLYYPKFRAIPAAMGGMAFWLFYAFADICVVIASGVLINSEVSIPIVQCLDKAQLHC